MEDWHHPDYPYQQRRESALAAHVLLIKAVINCAVQRTNDPDQYRIAIFLTTAPEPLRDPALALKLARRAVELKPGDSMCKLSLGWALYRTGDFRGSIETINVDPSHADVSSFIPAMAHWQLGEKTEARAMFEDANEWLKEDEKICDERSKQRTVYFPTPVQLKRLQAEATLLIKDAATSQPKTASPENDEGKPSK
jgi:tetratricopeptide (TPR) repeat protein